MYICVLLESVNVLSYFPISKERKMFPEQGKNACVYVERYVGLHIVKRV